MTFFETYANEYDLLTGAADRIVYHRKEVQSLIDRYHPKKVLDAGCATGLTSMLFASQGVTTVGLDRSLSMIKVAKEKYGELDLPLSFQRGTFEKLPKRMAGKFDLVVCLANSISGVGSHLHLRDAMNSFHAVLKPGGCLVMQLLNYASMRENQLTPIKVTTNNGIIYERFAERHGRRFYVYVTRLDTNQEPPKLEVFRHDFDNFSINEVVKTIRTVGFARIGKFSDLYLERPFLRTASDVVLGCKKQG